MVILNNIDNESTNVGRIDIDDAKMNPDIFRQKVDEKIKAILNRYGYTFAITEFHWINGQIQANIDLVKSPENITEQ